MKSEIFIPADVPYIKHDLFIKNYTTLTHNTNRLFLFSCDQKIEHLNKDFYGDTIHPDALHPEHIFKIAQHGNIGGLATHLGLIARHAQRYNSVPYIVKLNGKTDIIKTENNDPMSKSLWSVADVMQFKKETNLIIPGIAITVYLGSEYESELLAQAAHIVYQAHQEGLIALIFAYYKGKALEHYVDNDLAAGATGIAHSLGADFIKIKTPDIDALTRATIAAGNSGVICAGGPQIEILDLLKTIYSHIQTCNISGVAIGRNIFQRSHNQAIALATAIADIVYNNSDSEKSFSLYKNMMQKTV